MGAEDFPVPYPHFDFILVFAAQCLTPSPQPRSFLSSGHKPIWPMFGGGNFPSVWFDEEPGLQIRLMEGVSPVFPPSVLLVPPCQC